MKKHIFTIAVAAAVLLSCGKSETSQESEARDTTISELRSAVESLSKEVSDLRKELDDIKGSIPGEVDAQECCGSFTADGLLFSKEGRILSTPKVSTTVASASDRESVTYETTLDEKGRIVTLVKSIKVDKGTSLNFSTHSLTREEHSFQYNGNTVTETLTTKLKDDGDSWSIDEVKGKTVVITHTF